MCVSRVQLCASAFLTPKSSVCCCCFFLFITSLNRENEIINGEYSIVNSTSFCLYYFKKEKRNKNRTLEFI